MFYNCVFDHNIPVDEENFAVGILRKPDGTNPEHAFLVVEGRDSSKAILRRYDLYFDEKNNPEKRSEIKVWPEINCPEGDAERIFKSQVLNKKEAYSKAWGISKQQADSLHQDILRDEKNPPLYQLSGDRSLLMKSSSREGESCFTWARHKLHNLKDERIKLPEKYSDFIAAKTSLYIKGVKEKSSTGCAVF